MLTLYDNWDSGNGYKVRLTLAHLHKEYRLINLDTDAGETRTADYPVSYTHLTLPTNSRV